MVSTSVAMSPENQRNVSKLEQKRRSPVQPTKVIRQLGRGGAGAGGGGVAGSAGSRLGADNETGVGVGAVEGERQK